MKNDDQLSFPFEARDEQPSGASDLKSAIHLAAASEPNLPVTLGKILAFPQSAGMQQSKRAMSDQALIARILNRARFFS